jgi:tripeptide aminopeptidase
VSVAPAAERERVGALFAELCAIPSPSGEEAVCAQRVAGELGELGLDVAEDHVGNLLARIDGGPQARRTVLLCAHLDTVPHAGPIEPVCEDGVWRNLYPDAILGADNKAAIAVLLVLARALVAAPAPVGVELLFTVGEEEGLRGASAVDIRKLEAAWGYVFDHASPIGEVVVASPTYHRLEAEFHGASAHAGIRPEDGRSAILAAARAIAGMDLGRLDPETTANVGTIHGGSAVNVVPERCRVELEARSLDPSRVESVVAALVDRLHDGANAAECDVDVSVARLVTGYRTRPGAPELVAAEAALRACGHEPSPIVTGGASDANALQATGLPCVNLANGTLANHQPDERVSAAALEQMLCVTRALLDACARVA